MNWKDILKEDFSFRDVVKNSRGVYAGVFDRIQDTPSLSRLGAAVLGDTLAVVKNSESSVAQQRKAAEVVLMEPMLIAMDMMNDPEMEEDIDNLRREPIHTIESDEEEGEKGEELSPEIIDSINKLAQKSADTVKDGVMKKLTEVSINGLNEVITSKEFIGYVAVVLSAFIRKMVAESTEMAMEFDNEVEVDDRGFSEDFMEANKMDWFNHLKE
tara:strand:+ start:773 stop:1414 length:642 start_codon:yes stop_codon:yes gene_type:complete